MNSLHVKFSIVSHHILLSRELDITLVAVVGVKVHLWFVGIVYLANSKELEFVFSCVRANGSCCTITKQKEPKKMSGQSRLTKNYSELITCNLTGKFLKKSI